MNKQIEREEVLKPCLKICEQLLLGGAIIQYRRLDVFDRTHIDGSPDIEIFLPKDNLVWILMAECKKPEGGVISKSQINYRDKYKDFKNVVYEIITSPKQLQKLVLSLSDYNLDKGLFEEMMEWKIGNVVAGK